MVTWKHSPPFSVLDKVVYARCTEQQSLAGTGQLLAIALGEEETRDVVKAHPGIELACINSPTSCVVAGPLSSCGLLCKVQGK